MNGLRTLVLATLLVGAMPLVAQAALWPMSPVGTGQGVQIKEWNITDHELDMMQEAGLSYVRFPMPWYAVEKGRGRFSWRAFDPVLEKIRARGMHAIVVLGAGHPAYTGTAEQEAADGSREETYPPATTPESIAAFVSYVRAAAEHFGTSGIVWELWNEPDSKAFWFPVVNVDSYIALMTPACQTLKQVDPVARVIGPAMAGMPGPWGSTATTFLARVLDSPLADCLDAVSLHPYRDRETPPETVLVAYDKARLMIEKSGKHLSIIASEWGFTTAEVTGAEQADYLLRTYLLNLMAGVPVSIWYEWYDSLTGAEDPEAHFGLLTHGKKTKEAYKALRAFLPALRGLSYGRRIEGGAPDEYLLLFTGEQGRRSLVYWTAAKDKVIPLPPSLSAKGQTLVLTGRPQWMDLDVPSQSVEERGANDR